METAAKMSEMFFIFGIVCLLVSLFLYDLRYCMFLYSEISSPKLSHPSAVSGMMIFLSCQSEAS